MSRRDFVAGAAAGAAGLTAGCRAEGTPKPQGSGTHEAKAPAPSPVLRTEALGAPPWRTEDPFLFCVHHLDAYPKGDARMAPAASLAGRHIGSDFSGRDGWSMYHGDAVPGFPRHPHRGFETVTVTRQGYVDHSDSMGATARYGQGDVQWMTAGRGIEHAEMFPLRSEAEPNPMEMFQIWLNLPSRSKMVEPHFSMFWGEDVPVHVFEDAAGKTTKVVTVAGTLGDASPPAPPPSSWAAQADAKVAIWTITLDPGATWTLPAADPDVKRTLYFFDGRELKVADQKIGAGQRILLKPGLVAPLEAGPDGAQVLLLEGRPIGEPVAQHGPFVMNSRQELAQAYQDYQRGLFGRWPWPSNDHVHAREEGRFALHADGKRDEPA